MTLTSIPINVGRMYKLAVSVCGTHSWSLDTKRFIHWINCSPSNVGSPERFADKFIRFIFMFGRNTRIRPSTPRYDFMPSNNWNFIEHFHCKIELRLMSEMWSVEKLFPIGGTQWNFGWRGGESRAHCFHWLCFFPEIVLNCACPRESGKIKGSWRKKNTPINNHVKHNRSEMFSILSVDNLVRLDFDNQS